MEENQEKDMVSLYKALSEFRQNIKQPAKDGKNPYFKSAYVTLDGVIKAVDEAMSGTGLSFIQEVATVNGLPAVRTVLMHEKGGVMMSGWLSLPLKQNATPQDVGSLITYAKRYQLAGFMGVASDVDDDSMQSSQYRPNQGYQQQNSGYYQPQQSRQNNGNDVVAHWRQVMAYVCQRLGTDQKTVMNAIKQVIAESTRYKNYANWSDAAKRNAEIAIMRNLVKENM